METDIDIALLKELEAKATPLPWTADRFDDDHCATAIAVRANLPDNEGRLMNEFIAATLIQHPSYVVPSDMRHLANANFIAEVRNALPELLRLAEIGKAVERDR
jgi:hypothetical protein